MKISIAEGLYLIALDDEEGKLLAAAEKTIIPGVMSAILLELHVLEKLALDNNTISVTDTTPTTNPVLDMVLSKVRSGIVITDAVDELSVHFKDILKDMDNLLVERGILRKESTRLLWIPLSQRMNNENYAYEKEIRSGMKLIVFKKAKPTPAFLILMSLIYYCNLLDEVFREKDDLIDAEKVAKDLADSPVATPAVSRALKTLREYLGQQKEKA